MRRLGGAPHAAIRIGVLLAVLSLLPASPAVSFASGGTTTGTVRVSPLLVSLELSAAQVQVGQTVQARATVSNIGRTLLKRITVELRFDAAGVRIAKPVAQIAQLKAGKSEVVSWPACGRVPGSYLLLARVTLDGVSIDSPASLLTVVPGGKKACP